MHKDTGFEKLAKECQIILSGASDWDEVETKEEKIGWKRREKHTVYKKKVAKEASKKEETDCLSKSNTSISDAEWLENTWFQTNFDQFNKFF